MFKLFKLFFSKPDQAQPQPQRVFYREPDPIIARSAGLSVQELLDLMIEDSDWLRKHLTWDCADDKLVIIGMDGLNIRGKQLEYLWREYCHGDDNIGQGYHDLYWKSQDSPAELVEAVNKVGLERSFRYAAHLNPQVVYEQRPLLQAA